MMEEENTPNETGENISKGFDSDKDKGADDYYAVDNPKKTVITTIGDGEMHNEGLVGEGNISDDGTFSEGTTSEQDEAENHDSEG